MMDKFQFFYNAVLTAIGAFATWALWKFFLAEPIIGALRRVEETPLEDAVILAPLTGITIALILCGRQKSET